MIAWLLCATVAGNRAWMSAAQGNALAASSVLARTRNQALRRLRGGSRAAALGELAVVFRKEIPWRDRSWTVGSTG